MSKLAKFIAILFLVSTIVSVYSSVHASSEYGELVEMGFQDWLSAHPESTSKDYLNEVQSKGLWIVKTNLVLNLFLALDAVVLIVFMNLYFVSFLDFFRKKKSKSFNQISKKEQETILSNVFCKSCVSKQDMIFIKELNTEGIKRYQLECKKCGETTKVRKNKE